MVMNELGVCENLQSVCCHDDNNGEDEEFIESMRMTIYGLNIRRSYCSHLWFYESIISTSQARMWWYEKVMRYAKYIWMTAIGGNERSITLALRIIADSFEPKLPCNSFKMMNEAEILLNTLMCKFLRIESIMSDGGVCVCGFDVKCAIAKYMS